MADVDFLSFRRWFISLQWVFHVILSDQFWGEDLVCRFPRVVHSWVALPFDQVLELPFFIKMAVICDFFDPEFF